MHTFTPSRFARLLRHDFRLQRRYLLSQLGLLFIIFLFLEIVFFMTRGAHHAAMVPGDVRYDVWAHVAVVMFRLVVIASLGSSFNHLLSQRQATACLTLPASSLEKFLSCTLGRLLAFCVLFVLALLLADAARMLVFWLMGWNAAPLLLPVAGRAAALLFPAGLSAVWTSLFPHALFLWVATCFLLGGILFGRYALLKSYLLLALADAAVGACLPTQDDFLITPLVHHEVPYAVSPFVVVLFLALSVFNAWAAYRLFTRKQIARTPWHPVCQFRRPAKIARQ